MQTTMTSGEAETLSQELIDGWRIAYRRFGVDLAEKIDGPHADAIGSKVQELIDGTITDAEADLLRNIRDLPTVEATTGR